MVTSHRDFDARPQTAPEVSGTFKLGGTTWKIRSRSEVPFGLVRQLIGGGDDDGATTPEELEALPPEEQRERARRVLLQTDDFFASTIIPEQVDDFLALLNDPSGPVSTEVPTQLAQYITQCLFAQSGPTEPSSPARAGRRATGSTSKAVSSSRVTAKKRSAV